MRRRNALAGDGGASASTARKSDTEPDAGDPSPSRRKTLEGEDVVLDPAPLPASAASSSAILRNTLVGDSVRAGLDLTLSSCRSLFETFFLAPRGNPNRLLRFSDLGVLNLDSGCATAKDEGDVEEPDRASLEGAAVGRLFGGVKGRT